MAFWLKIKPVVILVILASVVLSPFFVYPAFAQESQAEASIVFNPTGTHIDDEGRLIVRLDVYLGDGSLGDIDDVVRLELESPIRVLSVKLLF